MAAKPKTIVLLSGGIDSTTTVVITRAQGFDVYTLAFRYGQRNTQLAVQYCLEHPRWRLSLQTHKLLGIP